MTCQTNEKRVFSNQKVIERLEELDVVLIKADATKASPEIDVDLFRFDRANLPVNILVPADPDQPLIMMPEFFGAKEALEALELAEKGKS